MTDYKEYAKQMRENAVKNEQGNIVCSPELWEEIASVIERAIVPPCKVGDTVYYFSHRPFNLSILPNTIYEADVVRIVTTRLETSVVIQIRNEYGCTEISQISDFGKTVFLTKEEAVQKLKELNDNVKDTK